MHWVNNATGRVRAHVVREAAPGEIREPGFTRTLCNQWFRDEGGFKDEPGAPLCLQCRRRWQRVLAIATEIGL